MATLAINTDWDSIDFEKAQLQDLVIRNPKEAGAQFTTLLKYGGRVTINVPAFPTWKTVTLGTYEDVESLKNGLERRGFKVGSGVNDTITKSTKLPFRVAEEKTKVNLVNVSVGELGFTKVTPLRDIYARAIQRGLSLCPAEVGPQLRLQYANQPVGEWLHIAMEAIINPCGCIPFIFLIGRNKEGLWLSDTWGGLSCEWPLANHLIFRK